MKIKYLLFALVFGAIVACDPQIDDKDLKVTSVTKLEIGTLEQYSDAEGTVADPNGKYFYYEFPDVPSVVIYYVDEGVEITLDSGKSGGIFEFRIMTEETEIISQTLYFRYVDVTGKEVSCSTDVTFNSTELTTEIRYLAGMNGKAWTWDTSAPDGCVWGNMGFRAGTFEERYGGSGKWWGVYCTSKDEEGPAYDDDGNLIEGETDGCSFESQTQHMSTEHTFETSGGNLKAYMTFGSSGAVSCYDANNNLLRSGVWDISDYDESGESHRGFYQGFFNVTNGAILWPYEINYNSNYGSTDGHIIETFELVKLTDTQMMLAYPDFGFGDDESSLDWNWGEATFWYFCVDDREVYIPTNEESLLGCDENRDDTTIGWTWASDWMCWGNLGYGGGTCTANSVGGMWWCLAYQIGDEGIDEEAGITDPQHEPYTIEDVFYVQFGPGSSPNQSEQTVENEGIGAYMVFDKSYNLTKYNKYGEQVGSGSYDIDWDKTVQHITADEDNSWTNCQAYGWMTTTGDGILLPYQINGGGSTADWFDIAYLDENCLILINQRDGIYPAAWSEATFWRFERKKASDVLTR